MALSEQQRTRLGKAITDLRHAPGFQDIQRFIVAEAAADDSNMERLLLEITQMFRAALTQEAVGAVERRRATGR